LNESREIALEDAAKAARHRKVAVNYRMLAAFATDDGLSSAYRKLASDYEALADVEERVALASKASH